MAAFQEPFSDSQPRGVAGPQPSSDGSGLCAAEDDLENGSGSIVAGDDASFNIFYANVTFAGSKVRQWVIEESSSFDCVGMVETHLGPTRAKQLRRAFKKAGFVSNQAVARETERGGFTGGVISGLRPHLKAQFAPL